MDQLDAQVEAAVENYDTANAELTQTQAAAEQNEKDLAAAETDLQAAQVKLSARLVDIYEGGDLSVIDTLVGSVSFSDLINRLGLLERLSRQDSELVAQVTSYREEVAQRKTELDQQLVKEKAYTAEAAAAEKSVKAQLAVKQKALEGKEAQVAQLEKEEAANQAALAAEARQAAEEALKAQQAAQSTTTTTQRLTTTTTTRRTTTTSQKPTTTTGHTSTTGEIATTTRRTTTTSQDPTTTTGQKPTTTTTDAPSPGGTSGAAVVEYALNFLGAKYVWGGSTPSGFDCSGFVMYVYKHFGIYLPHSSSMQSTYGMAVSRADLQLGDLVFFYSPIHHVGIYIGGGKMIDAAGTGKGVRIDYLWSSYNCGRRILH